MTDLRPARKFVTLALLVLLAATMASASETVPGRNSALASRIVSAPLPVPTAPCAGPPSPGPLGRVFGFTIHTLTGIAAMPFCAFDRFLESMCPSLCPAGAVPAAPVPAAPLVPNCPPAPRKKCPLL